MKLRILIVEDDQIIAESIASDLEKQGYNISGKCDSGESALKSTEDLLPDLILMDIVLKGELDGIQTAVEIQKRYHIPIIYLTDQKDDRTFQEAKLTVPANYLTKPFQPHQLAMAVDLALFKGSAFRFSDQFSFFKENNQAIKVFYSEILFLKSSRSYCEVVTKNRKFILSQPMKTVYKKIPYPNLVRISRTHCVNKDHVEKIMGRLLYIRDEKIGIGETYTHVLKDQFNII